MRTVYTPKSIGAVVCDMHGTNLRSHSELHWRFKVRSIIEFNLSDAGAQHSSLEGWLDALSRGSTTPKPYTNKFLIVVGETRDGWLPCAYMYDSRRFGMCEILGHAEALDLALTR